MEAKARMTKAAAVSDFLQLGANAFVGGLMVAIALSMITLALASAAKAGALDDATTLAAASAQHRPGSTASAAEHSPARADALWADEDD